MTIALLTFHAIRTTGLIAMQQAVSNIPSFFVAIRPELEAQAREKSYKAATDVSDLIILLFNGSSLGLYRIQENIHRRVPQLVRDKQEIKSVSDSITKANRDLIEAKEIISTLTRINSFAISRMLIMKVVKPMANESRASR